MKMKKLIKKNQKHLIISMYLYHDGVYIWILVWKIHKYSFYSFLFVFFQGPHLNDSIPVILKHVPASVHDVS